MELAPDFVQCIDWELFKKQRADLIRSINDLKIEAQQAGSAGDEERSKRYLKQVDSLNGIVHLTDSICDYAVDFCELPEDKVMLTDENE